MPRHQNAVKIKSSGAVDIHLHGAFGIDLMKAAPADLDRLALQLAKKGVAAFCPTTLSAPWPELLAAVGRLGAWTQLRKHQPLPGHAQSLGIHLEGPFLHPGACGAHPPQAIRPFAWNDLEALWEASHGQLKLLTLAAEKLNSQDLKKLGLWAKKRKITLSLGHSQANEQQALTAFRAGFSNITHGWNALNFHQRSPGVMGAGLGNPDVFIELILDQIHVSPTVLRWTRKIHGPRLCYVSDCTPAAATPSGSWHSMGPLKIRFKDGASRLKEGHLAGGGRLLPDAFARWIESEAKIRQINPATLLREELPSLSTEPLRALGLNAKKPKLLQVEWQIGPQGRILLLTAPPQTANVRRPK